MKNSIQKEYPNLESLVAFLSTEVSPYLSGEIELALDKGFMEMGLDSIEIMDMGLSIEEKIGVEIEADQLFEFNTINNLAAYLFQEIHPEKSTPKKFSSESKLVQSKNEVAIIGMGCRFPGYINNPDDLWNLLEKGENALEKPVTDRKVYKEALGGFLSAIEYFDAQHFGISPREALSMDPQQRILLEVTWDALRNAGLEPQSLLNTNTGVYLGISNNDYPYHIQQANLSPSLYQSTGNALSIASGRIAYLLGLSGPCISIDTACSSSLVALHLACQDLKKGVCDFAIVAGVNLILDPAHSDNLKAAGMLSPEGLCKSFDVDANGFVRSEGFGVVILALNTKENIKPLALIKGSAVNQDGHSSGLSAPSIKAQEEVIHAALQQAGVKASEVDYIEAHGSATPIGDTIELNAIKRSYTPRRNPIFIGSIKASIGHAEAASGIAGVIKTTLALLHQKLPAQPHFKQKNTQTKLTDEEGLILKELSNWPRGKRSRLAGISSFGFSGTNCHLILAEANTEEPLEEYKSYPYQREYFWPAANQISEFPLMKIFNHPILQQKIALANGDTLYAGVILLEDQSYLLGHNIFSHILFPGAAFCELFLAVALDQLGQQTFSITQFALNKALILQTQQKVYLQLLVHKGQLTLYATYTKDTSWEQYASAKFEAERPVISLNNLEDQINLNLTAEPFYEFMNQNGIYYGDEFQVIKAVQLEKDQVTATLKTSLSEQGYLVHPVLLDGCFQTAVTWAVMQNKITSSQAYLPISIDEISVYKSFPSQILVGSQLLDETLADTMHSHIFIYDLEHQPVARIKRLVGKGATLASIERQLLAPVNNKKSYNKPEAWLFSSLNKTPKKRQLKIIKDCVAEEVRQVLKLKSTEAVDMKAGFFDMGMDSLMLLELQERVQQAVGNQVVLNRTAGFDYPNPDALAEKIYKEFLALHEQDQQDSSLVDELTMEQLIQKIDEDPDD